MKDAAIDVRRLFYSGCPHATNDILGTSNVRGLQRVAVYYRRFISYPDVADYIRGNYEDVLDALGLRFQLYDDGRVRLYLTN